MKSTIIIGAGLSGLLVAYRLKKSGIKVLVLEARDRIGGRIFTRIAAGDVPLEMGATWFGPQHKNVKDLLDELEIPFFEQYARGNAYFEATPLAPPEMMNIPLQPPSFRIVGGTTTMIEKLADKLSSEEVILNEPVQKLSFDADSVQVQTTNHCFQAAKVVCCLPPALLVNTIIFSPQLPEDFTNVARTTHTWMGEAVKAGVVYQRPFWKDKKISALFSNHGPITEFYDHTDITNSKFALCGFLHPGYQELAKETRKQEVLHQLRRLFGKKAEEYLEYEEVIWTNEEYTKGSSSLNLQPHQNSGNPTYQNHLFGGKLVMANSETSPVYGGYMEGAIYAANTAAHRISKN